MDMNPTDACRFACRFTIDRKASGRSEASDSPSAGTMTSMKLVTGLLLLTALALVARPRRPVDEFETNAGKVTITPVRHASLMIEANGKVIQVDPWSQGNYEGLPKADLILVTDIHPDHLDPQEIGLLKKDDTTILAPAAVVKSVPQAKVIGNGEKTSWEGWAIEAVPMYNIRRGPAEGKFYH